MLDAGLFVGQRLELIDGDLINKMGQNPPHAFAIQRLMAWLMGFLETDCVRVQLPMQAGGEDTLRSLPEPDLAVLRAPKPEHRFHHPRGEEMLLVIEVSDSTLAYDRKDKAPAYARNGVREYWLLNLTDNVLEVFREPSPEGYRETRTLRPEETIAPLAFPDLALRVGDFLP